jgi:hypothetical protein
MKAILRSFVFAGFVACLAFVGCKKNNTARPQPSLKEISSDVRPVNNTTTAPTPTSTSTGTGATITFNNATFTEINITFNGLTKIIAVGGTATFSGSPNGSAGGQATTYGKTSGGSQIGELIGWTLSYNFPSAGGNSNINLNVTSTYFFLKMRNSGTQSLNPVYVNYGLTSQTIDNVTIPNDGITYKLGYYKAFSNGNVRAYRGSSYTYWDHGVQYTLPGTNNQSVELVNYY